MGAYRHPRDNGQEQEQHDAEVLALAVEEACSYSSLIISSKLLHYMCHAFTYFGLYKVRLGLADVPPPAPLA